MTNLRTLKYISTTLLMRNENNKLKQAASQHLVYSILEENDTLCFSFEEKVLFIQGQFKNIR